MFRSSTIPRELVQSPAKVIFLSKHSVKLCRILCGDVAACRETVCVLFVVQTIIPSSTQGLLPSHSPVQRAAIGSTGQA